MSDSKTVEFLKGLFIGGVVGSVVAILYAPQSGKETREDLSKRSDEFMTRAREEYDATLEKSKKSYAAAVERLKELEKQARLKVDEVEAQFNELTARGKETVEESRGRLKKAIDAGVDAYKEEKDDKKKKS